MDKILVQVGYTQSDILENKGQGKLLVANQTELNHYVVME